MEGMIIIMCGDSGLVCADDDAWQIHGGHDG